MVITSRQIVLPNLAPELLDNFADNEWSTIIWACQTGNVPETWTVGSQKAMTINGKDYLIDIIGKNHDDYAAGGKAPLTFQMHEVCANSTINAGGTNVGGWESCRIRVEQIPKWLGYMPTEVQSAIREVTKLSTAGNASSNIVTTADTLFLLATKEVFNSGDELGAQYEYYAAGNSKIKYDLSGTEKYWWLRNASTSDSTKFHCVSKIGGSGSSGSGSLWAMCFAFCF